jgi:hypothetical protein
MVLTALLNEFNEPLELWLSTNHSGKRPGVGGLRRSAAAAQPGAAAHEHGEDDNSRWTSGAPCAVCLRAGVLRACVPATLTRALSEMRVRAAHTAWVAPAPTAAARRAGEDDDGVACAPAELCDVAAAPTVFVTYPRQDALCHTCRVRPRTHARSLAHAKPCCCCCVAFPRHLTAAAAPACPGRIRGPRGQRRGAHLLPRLRAPATGTPVHSAHLSFAFASMPLLRLMIPTALVSAPSHHQLGEPPLMHDPSAAAAVASLPALCRWALVRDANGRVRLAAASRCGEHAPLATLARHEARCAARPLRCGLPGASAPAGGRCAAVVAAAELPAHAAACAHRAVPCAHAGCAAAPQARHAAAHAFACAFAPAACAAPGCGWRGLRGSIAAHAAVCPCALVTCDNADSEPPAQACPHACARLQLAAHGAACEFRTLRCEACGAACAARRMPAHARTCGERTTTCPMCSLVNTPHAAPCCTARRMRPAITWLVLPRADAPVFVPIRFGARNNSL